MSNYLPVSKPKIIKSNKKNFKTLKFLKESMNFFIPFRSHFNYIQLGTMMFISEVHGFIYCVIVEVRLMGVLCVIR